MRRVRAAHPRPFVLSAEVRGDVDDYRVRIPALSPTRQLALPARIHDLVRLGSQFVIATHSPIVMAYPEATIYLLDDGLRTVRYEETEHYLVMRDFMNRRERMLRELMK
jgi:predicted ATPase